MSALVGLGVAGLLLLNLVISAFNAYAVGRTWADTKHMGGFPHFMNWMGATMSACGFTWCYLLIIAFIVNATGKLPADAFEAMISLGYLVVIFPILGSGLAITMNSIVIAWRQRRLRDIGVAGWNSFAQVYNTYNAVRAVPDAFGTVFDFFRPKNKDGAIVFLVMLMVIIAVAGGILTTSMIIRATARAQAGAMLAKGNRRYRYAS